MLLKGNDPFILNLLTALGISTERLASATIVCEAGSDPVEVVARYLAVQGEAEVAKRLQLARPAALEGLLSEFEGGRIRAVEVAEGDTVVFRCPQNLDAHQRDYVERTLDGQFPENKVLVLDGGAELVVVKAADQVLDTSSL